MALRLQLAKKCGANQYIYIRHAATPLQSKSLQYDTMYKTTQCNTMQYNAIQCVLTLHNECMWNSRPHGMGQRANHQTTNNVRKNCAGHGMHVAASRRLLLRRGLLLAAPLECSQLVVHLAQFDILRAGTPFHCRIDSGFPKASGTEVQAFPGSTH